MVLKGAHRSFRNEDKKEKQAALFPVLLDEIDKRRSELAKGYKWPDLEARRSVSYRDHLAKEGASLIGGTPPEQRRDFDEVIARFPECYWSDGCARLWSRTM